MNGVGQGGAASKGIALRERPASWTASCFLQQYKIRHARARGQRHVLISPACGARLSMDGRTGRQTAHHGPFSGAPLSPRTVPMEKRVYDKHLPLSLLLPNRNRVMGPRRPSGPSILYLQRISNPPTE